MKILIVEDEEIQRVALLDDLLEVGHDTTAVASGDAAVELLAEATFDVILADLKMPGIDGMELLQHVKALQPSTTVIMMTAYGNVETAVHAMKLGAYDYLTKPFSVDELLLVLNRVQNYRSVTRENRRLKSQIETRYSFDNIIGKSQSMQDVFRQLEIAAPSDTTVLLEGETGTGKELAANAIHYNSPRKRHPFIKVSCAMLSKEILESELFGHEKGAFTGAYSQKKGRFELANGGSILLDEVDDISVELQVKLLRVLEEQTFERVGGTKTLKVDVRVIAATKVDLNKLVARDVFRQDLFYRLSIYPIRLPALREREGDAQDLLEHFLHVFNSGNQQIIEPDVYPVLAAYSWPGNVRELRNLAERLTLICQGRPITRECLPSTIQEQAVDGGCSARRLDGKNTLGELVAQFEWDLIRQTLAKVGGNKARASELLRIPASTLKSKIKKYLVE